ncbi:SLATT domain-containing protein [Flavobacterium sp. N502536]|uniref:SLATT domain-containing protein n=1 Tax=Flavobacterium sp. N502536 TaxID=2986837 RepID=UPI0022228361|nr:SLATT domain-containing protein [Flavobacterium sp. N502536]
MENGQLKFLKDEINKRISRFDSSRLYYRKISFWAYLSVTILAAVSTIILGLKIDELKEIPRISALIITGLITIISAYNTFFDNKGMWVAYNTALNDLYRLKFEIEFLEQRGEIIDSVKIDLFKLEYQEIVGKLNKTWAITKMK